MVTSIKHSDSGDRLHSLFRVIPLPDFLQQLDGSGGESGPPMLRDLQDARAHHGDILDRCAQLIDGGRLSLTVGHCLPLEQAARAHVLLEAGGMQGKVVLEIG